MGGKAQTPTTLTSAPRGNASPDPLGRSRRNPLHPQRIEISSFTVLNRRVIEGWATIQSELKITLRICATKSLGLLRSTGHATKHDLELLVPITNESHIGVVAESGDGRLRKLQGFGRVGLMLFQHSQRIIVELL